MSYFNCTFAILMNAILLIAIGKPSHDSFSTVNQNVRCSDSRERLLIANSLTGFNFPKTDFRKLFQYGICAHHRAKIRPLHHNCT